jgi:hypothetical protein
VKKLWRAERQRSDAGPRHDAQGRGDRFGLSYGLARRTGTQVRELYANLATKVRDGVPRAPVEATNGIDDIKEALVQAQRRGRHGKVLVLQNGKL